MTQIIVIGIGVFVLAVIEMIVIVLVYDCQHEDEENGDDEE